MPGDHLADGGVPAVAEQARQPQAEAAQQAARAVLEVTEPAGEDRPGRQQGALLAGLDGLDVDRAEPSQPERSPCRGRRCGPSWRSSPRAPRAPAWSPSAQRRGRTPPARARATPRAGRLKAEPYELSPVRREAGGKRFRLARHVASRTVRPSRSRMQIVANLIRNRVRVDPVTLADDDVDLRRLVVRETDSMPW